MYEFDIFLPTSVDDAVEKAGEDQQFLAGGQTLIPTLKQRLAMPEALVSLSKVAELRGICRGDDGALCIGAMTTHANVAQQSDFPALAELADGIGDPAVRNRGTIGGSLANNDPAACYPAAVLGTAATVVTNTRRIAADDFFTGLFETALEEGELITEVQFPIPDSAVYAKFVQPASRFAIVGVFIARFGTDVRVAITGAGENGVFRWAEAENALADRFQSDALEGVGLGDVDILSDIHAAEDYRRHLVTVMTKRAINRLCSQ